MRLVVNVLALLVISGGSAHLYAQEDKACCTSPTGAQCCGNSCKAGPKTCCADAACGPAEPT